MLQHGTRFERMKGGMNHYDDSDPLDFKMTKEEYISFAEHLAPPDLLLVTIRIHGLLYVWAMLLLVGRILTLPHLEATSVILPLTQMGICIVLFFGTQSERISASHEARLIRNLCLWASCLAVAITLVLEQPIFLVRESEVLPLLNYVPLEFAGLAVWAEIERRSRLKWEAFVKSVQDSSDDDWLEEPRME